MDKVDREVDAAIRDVTPTLSELSKRLEAIESDEVKVATLVFIILRLLGASKIPHALAIGALEVCKSIVLSVAMTRMMMPDSREMHYIA